MAALPAGDFLYNFWASLGGNPGSFLAFIAMSSCGIITSDTIGPDSGVLLPQDTHTASILPSSSCSMVHRLKPHLGHLSGIFALIGFLGTSMDYNKPIV